MARPGAGGARSPGPDPGLLLLLSALLWIPGSRPGADAAGARSSSLAEGQCGSPPPVAHAQIAEGATDTSLRYSCVKNYKRKAGTSSLIVCKYNKEMNKSEWTKPNLICITDPSLPSGREPETEDSRREAETSTPSSPKAAGTSPSVASMRPHDGTTDLPQLSPGAVTSGPATTTAGCVEEVKCTPPGEVTESVNPSHRSSTSVAQARASETLPTRSGSTVTPSEKTTGNTTQVSVPTDPGSLTGFLHFKIGVPFLAVGLAVALCYLLWCLGRRKSCFWRRSAPPGAEGGIAMAAAASRREGTNRDPLVGHRDDPELSDEAATMLSNPCTTSTHLAHEIGTNGEGTGRS